MRNSYQHQHAADSEGKAIKGGAPGGGGGGGGGEAGRRSEFAGRRAVEGKKKKSHS